MTFVIDASGSIGATDFEKVCEELGDCWRPRKKRPEFRISMDNRVLPPQVKSFIKLIAAAFTKNPHFGLVTFSNDAYKKKPLGSGCTTGTELQCFNSKVNNLDYPAQYTNTPAGLKAGREVCGRPLIFSMGTDHHVDDGFLTKP
jgi:hypothetical protein